MDTTIACSINKDSRAVIGSGVGVDQRIEFRFDLEQRQIVDSQLGQWPLSVNQKDYKIARNFFDELVGTPEKLMEFAKTGQLNKAVLTVLLNQEEGQEFLRACAILEEFVDIWIRKFQNPKNRIEIWRK